MVLGQAEVSNQGPQWPSGKHGYRIRVYNGPRVSGGAKPGSTMVLGRAEEPTQAVQWSSGEQWSCPGTIEDKETKVGEYAP